MSPCSSTNSLNSFDSSGLVMNQRLNIVPSIPNRKKRTAPRPPSQNSISEGYEQKYIGANTVLRIDQTEFNQSNLIRLCSNNNSSTETSIFIVDYPRNARIPLPNHPLPMQLNTSKVEDDDFECHSPRSNDSTHIRSHQRTSSETSNITKGSDLLGTQVKKIPPIGK